MNDPDPLKLTDTQWAEYNNLMQAWETGGVDALNAALSELTKADPITAVAVIGSMFPDMVRETIRDIMAEQGITVEDLPEMAEKQKGRN